MMPLKTEGGKKTRRERCRDSTERTQATIFPLISTQMPIWSREFARLLARTESCLPWAEVRALGPCPEGPASPATSPPSLRLQSYPLVLGVFRGTEARPSLGSLFLLPGYSSLFFHPPHSRSQTRACKQIINLGKLPTPGSRNNRAVKQGSRGTDRSAWSQPQDAGMPCHGQQGVCLRPVHPLDTREVPVPSFS